MIKILKDRITFISAIFAAFGYILSRLVTVENVSIDIASFCMVLSLAMSLIISLIISSEIVEKYRKLIISFSLVLFGITLYSAYNFEARFTRNTILVDEFKNGNTVTNKYFKGSVYTPDADSLLSIRPDLRDDDVALVGELESTPKNVWKESSIRDMELNLGVWYFFFVISLVAGISLAVETLKKSGDRRKKPKPKSRSKGPLTS
jgi:hypothetical protein